MIPRIFGAIVQFAIDLAMALIRGIFRAPVTAVERASQPVDVRVASAEEIPAALAIDAPHATLWVLAERDGQIIGAAATVGAGDRRTHVLPAWHGTGVAEAMLVELQVQEKAR